MTVKGDQEQILGPLAQLHGISHASHFSNVFPTRVGHLGVASSHGIVSKTSAAGIWDSVKCAMTLWICTGHTEREVTSTYNSDDLKAVDRINRYVRNVKLAGATVTADPGEKNGTAPAEASETTVLLREMVALQKQQMGLVDETPEEELERLRKENAELRSGRRPPVKPSETDAQKVIRLERELRRLETELLKAQTTLKDTSEQLQAERAGHVGAV